VTDVVDLAARPPDHLEPDEVAYLRALLAGRAPRGVDGIDVAPLATVIAEPGWVPSVAAGAVIESTWGNAVRDRLMHRFASTADRDTNWPAAPSGAMCITTDTGRMWRRTLGAWQAQGINPNVVAATTFPGLTSSVTPATTPLVFQAGTTVVTTDAGGLANTIFPRAFPNGLLTVVATIGWHANQYVLTSDAAFTAAQMQVKVINPSTLAVITGTVRLNWLAIGW